MKKFFFMAATAALALSSCSSEELVQTPEVNTQEGAVSFSAYSGRTTRAADNATDVMATKGGFGVFAYDQDTQNFTDFMAGNVTPNFMFNQQVKAYTSDNAEVTDASTQAAHHWAYTPVKYWSNNPDAKHSFFAYAPYSPDLSSAVGANPRLILNSLYGGPALEYSFVQTGGADILCAPAYINRTKPAVDKNDVATTGTSDNVNGKMQFQFKHALAKVSFNIQTWVDEKTDGPTGKEHADTPTATNKVDTKTKVIVKSLKLNGKFAKKGFLKLVDGTWVTSSAAHTDIELISTPITLEGEGKEETFDQLTDILFFPLADDEKFSITITYDVATDANNDGDYDDLNDSKITNVITSEGEGFALVQNTAYEYHLNLGLETVKFDATVTDWEDGKKTEVDLPANVWYTLVAPAADIKTLAAAKSGTAISATNFASLQVGKILMGTEESKLIAKECTKAATTDPVAEAEFKTVTYPYLLSSDGTTIYVYGTDSYTEKSITDKSSLLEIPNTAGYYKVNDKIYVVG